MYNTLVYIINIFLTWSWCYYSLLRTMPIMEPQFQRKVFFKPGFIGTSGEFLGIPGFKDIFPPLHPTKGSPPMRFSYQEFRSVSLCILVCKCKCSYRLCIVQRMSHCSDKANWCRETKGKKGKWDSSRTYAIDLSPLFCNELCSHSEFSYLKN